MGKVSRKELKVGKSLSEFIREHRDEIDKVIDPMHSTKRLNDEERRLWVLNYEALYLWARDEGVRI